VLETNDKRRCDFHRGDALCNTAEKKHSVKKQPNEDLFWVSFDFLKGRPATMIQFLEAGG
jgi:hypothetical protein